MLSSFPCSMSVASIYPPPPSHFFYFIYLFTDIPHKLEFQHFPLMPPIHTLYVLNLSSSDSPSIPSIYPLVTISLYSSCKLQTQTSPTEPTPCSRLFSPLSLSSHLTPLAQVLGTPFSSSPSHSQGPSINPSTPANRSAPKGLQYKHFNSKHSWHNSKTLLFMA